MQKRIDLANQTFGRLTVISFLEAVLMETRFGSVNVNVEINVLLTVNDFKKDSLAVVGVCDQK
ncbi:hypothetical protein FD51_GL001875 [Lacticaseibacillus zeae DSM 20178 = KCTC 3804]|uniref:Uncharacterized protein n=7 Tax=Lactobacillaceae TaxID=33958 RepID=A0A5R8LMC8_LACZE|nr:hypothetical protein [Lacticaseibacillus zeae]KRK10195.1 hypothetical protein FD51_GL001875 [Lacticaseibacillus zeae DSM 20178 = KCTC 3804]OLS06443.1 hypothetical protein AUQ39_10200 [Lacticaseibacillus casei]QVI33534.1 hypothetical protein KG087_12620 [Lacticaseibacillus zeae]TLF38345.1 hypothetical protein FEI14_14700 [Lacticaseibacillus zeae]